MQSENSVSREDALVHHNCTRRTIGQLQTRQDALWELVQDVAHPEFTERMREANLLAGRIQVLQERLSNIACGLPEMGIAFETIRPNTQTPIK